MQPAQKTPKNQSLVFLILGLIIVFLGLNSYLFASKIKNYSYPNTDDSSLNFFELSALFKSSSAYDIALIYGARDLKPYLENFRAASSYQGKSLTFKNPEKESYYGEFTEPIIINSSFRLLLNFDNQNTESELILSGKDNLQNNNWWENIHQLRIGYNKEEKGFYLSLLNGQKEGSVWYKILANTKPSETLILEFTDFAGQGFLVKDVSGQVLAEIDSTELKSLDMAEGLFPYSSMKIGINLAPGAKLKLNKLLIWQN